MRLACGRAIVVWASSISAFAQPPVPGDRMAAHHMTMVAVNETRPNAGIMTYVVDRFTQVEAYGLARVSVHAEVGGKELGPKDATEVRVRDIPGGVQATYRLGTVRVATEIVPLVRGRGKGLWEGAAVFSVRTHPPTPVELRVGGSRTVGFHSPRAAWLQADDPTSPNDSAMLQGNLALLSSAGHPLVVAVGGRPGSVAGLAADGRSAAVRLLRGEGRITVAYARDAGRATALASEHPMAARREVAGYYERLLKARIRTPEPTLDAAYRSAITTLEYNWIEPIGWNECIHHWYSLWHMQHSPAAEWIGQADRSRACIMEHAENLLPSGAAPQLSVDGRARRDFGGSNQFYAWQIRHYLRHTGDIEAARKLAPVLDRIIEQTWDEYDPDGNGLLAWGQQIGNQEDYVSTPNDGATPTIEGIQMLLTRAEVAELIGDRPTAQKHRRRAEELRRKLVASLWMPDLGRFAFFRDGLGVLRLDGQYHTFAYPAIYGVADALDAWASVRHMRDTLTGVGGEVYCSNNFPWHAVGTWGMQAGAAQQPWAAWALAATGHRNETVKPLLAAARWSMDGNHRGAWSEISVEPTPAYFSPPAGLYVQSVIEALFGLTLDAPTGTIRIRPSFPDTWPNADLHTPEVTALYRRSGGTMTYDLRTKRPMAAALEWTLPVCKVRSVRLNGRAIPYSTRWAVNGIVLIASAPPSRRAAFVIAVEPLRSDLRYARVAAEGDDWSVELRQGLIEGVEDRAGLLASVRIERAANGARVLGVIRGGLMRPYEPYGKLGRPAFSRRTMFLRCITDGGIRYVAPVTVTVLPTTEASAILKPSAGGATLSVRVRNNRSVPTAGPVTIRWAGGETHERAELPARSERAFNVAVPRNRLALLCAGDNAVEVSVAGSNPIEVLADAAEVHRSEPKLQGWMAARCEPIPLPSELLQDDAQWRQWREWYAYGHWPWANSRPPLEALGGKAEITVPHLPEVRFALASRRLIPVSMRLGRPGVTLELGGKSYRKLYLLVLPLLDNHDTFSPVGRVTVRMENGSIRARTLHFPGDLDWWCPTEVVSLFATARSERPDRLAMAARPDASGTARGMRPPEYPQPALWATCRALATPSAVMNVVELDLGSASAVRRLTLETVGSEAALGLVALTGERATGSAELQDTPYAPPPGLGEPTPVFALNRAGDLEGWTIEGEAFSVAPAQGLFSTPTLNSIAARGESATGRALSPPFKLTGSRLRFRLHGGLAARDAVGPTLAVRVLDAASGEELASISPTSSHIASVAVLHLARHRGKTVRLELVDRHVGAAYAWIGISDVVMEDRP